MSEPTPVNPNELLTLLRDAHMIKSALYLDPELAGSRTVTRQIVALNELTEKMIALYEQVTGKQAPTPAQTPSMQVAESRLPSFDAKKPETRKLGPRPKKRGRPKKTQEEKIADKLEELKKPVGRPKKKGPKRKKTTKVKGARKGPMTPPSP